MSDDDEKEGDQEGQDPKLPSDERKAGHLLLEQLRGGLVIEVVEEKFEELSGIVSGHVKLKISEDDVETSAFGIIFAVAIFSFKDALPAGYSKKDFQFHDEYKLSDFVTHLRYQRGRLHFYADYVRGRLMKTAVDIDRDGNVVIATTNRDRLVSRWVEFLMKLKVDEELLDDGDDGEVGPFSEEPPAGS